MKIAGKLYIIPTPVGNLGDMTIRAIETLKEVDLILAEDTRTSGVLLKHFDIHKPMLSHHMHNEHKSYPAVIDRVKAGENVALISDAGTPGISDPGFLLVRECLPGATALIPAIVVSGLPSDRFVFEGFLPEKKGRKTRMEALAEEERTIVFYESPYRLVKTLTQLMEFMGEDREASVSREISKLYEETLRGTLASLVSHFTVNEPRGELVVIIEGLSHSKKIKKQQKPKTNFV